MTKFNLVVVVSLIEIIVGLYQDWPDLSALYWMWSLPILNYYIITAIFNWIDGQRHHDKLVTFLTVNVAGVSGSIIMLIGSFPLLLLALAASVACALFLAHGPQVH